MATVIFNEETKEFSVVENQREFGVKDSLGKAAGAVGKRVSKNSRAYITGGSALAGAGLTAIIAKKRAEKAALAAGATEAEAKKAGKKAAIKGAAIGAAGGALAGELGQYGVGTVKGAINRYKAQKKLKDIGGNVTPSKLGSLKSSARAQFDQMYKRK